MMARKSLVQDLYAPEDLRRVTTEDARREGTAAEGGGPPVEGPVALLAFHGMGQQVRYGTIEETIAIVNAAAERRGCRVALKGRRQLAFPQDRFVGCAELLIESDSRRVEVHVYEAYWAPLAEGRISTWETFWFLLTAAWDCSRNGTKFTRFLFAKENPPRGEDKEVPPTTIAGLLLTVLTLAAIGILDLVIVAVGIAGVMVAGQPRWFPDLKPGLVADYAGAFLLLLVSWALCIKLPQQLAPFRERDGARRLQHGYAVIADVVLRLTALALCFIAFDIASQCVFAAAGATPRPLVSSLVSWIPFLEWFQQSRGGLLLIGALFFLGSSVVRWFIRKYVGDVAIYVSSHKANRFYETRQAIQKAAYEVAHFIFDRKGAGDAPLYRQVVFMGHSLGSVIAYDTLNRLFLEDTESGGGRNARARTRGLITYGSPLDKIAFVFRTQRRKDGSLREAMVAALQPLIQDLSARRFPWVNVYSSFDWIGGELDFYDPDPAGPGPFPEFSIANRRDDHALTPVAAHGEHGKGPLLQGVVLDALLGDLKPERALAP